MEAKYRFISVEFPQFFSEMGRKWCQQLKESYSSFVIHLTNFLTMVCKDHHLRNGSVEFHIADIVTHFPDGLMKNLQSIF